MLVLDDGRDDLDLSVRADDALDIGRVGLNLLAVGRHGLGDGGGLSKGGGLLVRDLIGDVGLVGNDLDVADARDGERAHVVVGDGVRERHARDQQGGQKLLHFFLGRLD